nr:nickel-dependent hydrogenase large subunit [Acidobacteriota bacterium]
EDERAALRPMAASLHEFARFSLRLFKDAVLGQSRWVEAILRGPYSLAVGQMGLVDARGAVALYDGTVRVVDCEGREIARFASTDYVGVIAEHVEPWTYLKFPHLRARGWRGFVEGPDSPLYAAGPLARLNVAETMATPEAEQARQELFATLGGRPSGALLANHWARLVEMLYAAERLIALVDDPELSSPEYRVLPDRITGEGVGIVEAMRGTLIHHYTCDEHGICTSANLIVGTTHNNAPIQMVTKKVASELIRPGVVPDAALLDRVEMAFRAFDPCYSCATHFLPGAMPLVARLHRGGRVVAELRRDG